MKFFVTGVGGQLGHDVMNELISIFIPPENATPEELEEAKALHDAIERRMHPHVDFKGVTEASEACCRQLEQWLEHPTA